jgi:hypothetical protein
MMMRRISLGLLLLLSLFFVAFGVLYASVSFVLPFHAAAVPPEAREAVQPIYFALMKLIGGTSIGLGLLGLYITLMPMRAGAPFIATALSIAFAIPLVMAAYVAETLAKITGAPTSWHIMGGLLAVTAAALGARAIAMRAQTH